MDATDDEEDVPEGDDGGDPLADDSEGEDDEPEDLEDGAPDEDGDDTTMNQMQVTIPMMVIWNLTT